MPPGMPPGGMMVMPRPCVLQALRGLQPQMAEMLTRLLSLSDDQKKQVAEVLMKAEEALKSKVEAQRKADEEFLTALVKEDSDKAALTAAGDKAIKAESAVLAEQIKTLLDLRALLSDQQKKDLGRFLEQRGMMWRAGGMPPPPRPPIAPPPPEPPKPPDSPGK